MADQPSGSSSPVSVSQQDGQTQFCLCQPEPKIPRPRNAFILYRQHQQAAVVRSHPGLPNPAISKIIGEQWSHLPEEEKDKWKALAEEEKARHAQQYPEYRYQPRRNGRYSSQSSGSGPPSGGKVDQHGNCVKCGGKTMNPPNTPYTVYPTTPPAPGRHPSQALTYSQGHRGSQQVLVSPPRTGVQSHGDRIWIPAHPHDPRYDPRPRYMSEQVDGPDLKRRRYEGGYIPPREVYREVPYPYSPREAQYVRADIYHDPHAVRSAMVPPPRALYPQQPPLPPKLQPIRPPPPQHKRNPSLTLPPLTNPSAQNHSSTLARQGSPNSGLEAMIMSIPVLNKVKILSQISPHLANPSVASPPRQIRGAIVAVEGLDSPSVYGMTNSLAEQLLKDGKFVVKIFSGPDSFAVFRGDNTKERKELAIADCLGTIGEWHKISEDMKRFITTKPVGTGIISPDSDVEMSTSFRNSVVMTDAPAAQPSEPSTNQTKTPESIHTCRPSKLDLGPPTKWNTASEMDDPPQSASRVSPKTVVADKTADLTISTPPVQKAGHWRDPWYRGENPDSPPYTRIPNIAGRGGIGQGALSKASREDSMDIDKEKDISKQPCKGTGKEVHFDASADLQSTSISNSTHDASNDPLRPSLTTTSSIPSDCPLPIALVPHYQLTTVDTSAIAVPIVDSYSPLAHWQWLATLWRGCIGPDVSVVIKSTATAADGSTGMSVPLGSGEDGSPGKVAGMSSPRSRQQSLATLVGGPSAPPTNTAVVAAAATNAANTITASSLPASTTLHPSNSTAHPTQPNSVHTATAAPGVEVRLLDLRTVVVRTNVSHHNKDSNANTEKGETEEDEETANKKREELEFWEKAKRRVGFEVAEFLRR